MMSKELEKHIKDRIKEEEKAMKDLFNIDIKHLDYNELSNIITRCNFTINLRLQLEFEVGEK